MGEWQAFADLAASVAGLPAQLVGDSTYIWLALAAYCHGYEQPTCIAARPLF